MHSLLWERCRLLSGRAVVRAATAVFALEKEMTMHDGVPAHPRQYGYDGVAIRHRDGHAEAGKSGQDDLLHPRGGGLFQQFWDRDV